MEYLISDKDKQILRETAKKQLELANMESNKARIQEWYRHNALQGEKPMIHLEMGTFSQEIIPPLLKCEGAFAKQVETALYSNFLNQELFDDDRVTPDYFPMEYDTFLNCSAYRFMLTIRRMPAVRKAWVIILNPLLKIWKTIMKS